MLRAAWRMVVPGSTSMVMLSIVTLNIFFSSGIFKIQKSKILSGFRRINNNCCDDIGNFLRFFKQLFNLPISIFIVSLIRQSQYLVSLADFNAMTKNFFQSLFE